MMQAKHRQRSSTGRASGAEEPHARLLQERPLERGA